MQPGEFGPFHLRRGFDCAQYAECLDQAARENRPTIGCRSCDRYRPAPYRPTEMDLMGCLKLAMALFRPDVGPALLRLVDCEQIVMRWANGMIFGHRVLKRRRVLMVGVLGCGSGTFESLLE